MAKTKQFQEIITENPNLYDNTAMATDTATQSLCYDWFKYRRVTSNNRFSDYYRRVINRDYSRYLQMLRIEAGKIGDTGKATNYDWLVLNYLESLDLSKFNQNTLTNKSDLSSVTPRTGKTIRESEAEKIDSIANTNTSNSESSEGSSNTTNRGTKDGHNNSATTAESREGSLSKATPMSAEYTASDISADNNRRGFAKASGSISEQGIIDHGRAISGFMDSSDPAYPSDSPSAIAGLNKDFPNLKIKNPSAVSDGFGVTGSVGENTEVEKTYDKSDSSYDSATSGTGSQESEASSDRGKSKVRVEEYTGGDSSNGAVSGVSNQDTDGEKKHIHTGRNGETALILQNVLDFIERCSAWDWFRKQLETCFMQCFDEEED